MPFQILLNLVIAFVWVSLTSWSTTAFFLGYLIGLTLIFAMRRFLHYEFYLKKVVAIIKLLLLFLKEILLSNIIVAKHVINPKLNIRPGIFALPTELKSEWEITTLALLITLTPGTLTLEVSPENDILYIHAIDISDAEEVIFQIKNSFEKAIMEVTR
jgi:multicomponent Na+:H+ antiporter subunit E